MPLHVLQAESMGLTSCKVAGLPDGEGGLPVDSRPHAQKLLKVSGER